jgi:hypothetical protein
MIRSDEPEKALSRVMDVFLSGTISELAPQAPV